jgi:predicted transcriptional regulator
MSGKNTHTSTTVRLPNDLQKKVERIAERNHLAVSDVIRIGLFQIIPIIEKDGITIQPGKTT